MVKVDGNTVTVSGCDDNQISIKCEHARNIDRVNAVLRAFDGGYLDSVKSSVCTARFAHVQICKSNGTLRTYDGPIVFIVRVCNDTVIVSGRTNDDPDNHQKFHMELPLYPL